MLEILQRELQLKIDSKKRNHVNVYKTKVTVKKSTQRDIFHDLSKNSINRKCRTTWILEICLYHKKSIKEKMNDCFVRGFTTKPNIF